jgi:hypothetical protein
VTRRFDSTLYGWLLISVQHGSPNFEPHLPTPGIIAYQLDSLS